MYEKCVVQPEVEPVSVEEQCNFSHIDLPPETVGSPPEPNLDYTLIQSYITAARWQVEQLTMTAMISQRWLTSWDFFPGADDAYSLGMLLQQLPNMLYVPNTGYRFPQLDSIDILRRPLQEADPAESSPSTWSTLEVKYLDLTGTEQTFDPNNYVAFADRITLKPNCAWPVAAQIRDAVRIYYPTGYGDDPSDVPERLKLAVKFLAGHFYENRVPVGAEPTFEVLMTLTSLLNEFKLYRVPR